MGAEVCKKGGFAHGRVQMRAEVCKRGGFAHGRVQMGAEVCKRGGFAHGDQGEKFLPHQKVLARQLY